LKIGIDIGGTNIAGGLVDNNYRIITIKSIQTGKDRPVSEIIADIAGLILNIAESSGISIDQVNSIGIGSPGIIDRDLGKVIYSNNIRWDDVSLRDGINRYIKKSVFLDNDANCAALGEFTAGAARGYSSAVVITFGTGIGGGIIIDNKLLHGFNSAANHIGHMTIVSKGNECTCGRLGCWETYASVTALIRMAVKAAKTCPQSELAALLTKYNDLDGEKIFQAVKNGDQTAIDVANQYFFFIAEGITNITNILQPEVIVLGGGLSNLGDFLLDPVIEQVKKDIFCKEVPIPEIKISDLKNNAGIIGAALLEEHQKSEQMQV
jgi:glucokinase